MEAMRDQLSECLHNRSVIDLHRNGHYCVQMRNYFPPGLRDGQIATTYKPNLPDEGLLK
jgi:hypothetical protein